MEYTILFPLLPKGKWARAGRYVKFSTRTLRFDIRLGAIQGTNYDTLDVGLYETFSLCASPTEMYAGGQGVERIAESYRDRVPKYRLADFDRLVKIWSEYHLNDKMAGTKKQDEVVEEWRKNHPYNYSEICDYLKERGLLYDRWYKYGSGWLIKPIPNDDLSFIHKICSEQGE